MAKPHVKPFRGAIVLEHVQSLTAGIFLSDFE